MPLFHATPLDSSPGLGGSTRQPVVAAAKRAALGPAMRAGDHARSTGQTCDGLPPTVKDGTAAVSRWVFDVEEWRWRRRNECSSGANAAELQAKAPPPAKHQLAARRWGDGRDDLAPAAAAMAADASTADAPKRQRLEPTGHRAPKAPPPANGFASLGGLAKQKDALLRSAALPLRHPALFARLGVPGPRGLLLHGPPGSGKTALVHALAAETGLPCVSLACGECAGEEGVARLRRAFARGESSGCRVRRLA